MTSRFVNVEDARHAARRLPRIVFDDIDGGSFGETTLRSNVTDFERYALRQRVLVDAQNRDLATTVLGRTHSLPFGLGPVGFTGLFSNAGELACARAAEAAGVPFCPSDFSIASLASLIEATRRGLVGHVDGGEA